MTDSESTPATESDDARQAVVEVIYDFGQALDTNDWPLYRRCLSDQLDVDYRQATGLPAVRTTAEAWTQFVRESVSPQTTVHYYTNIRASFPTKQRAEVTLNHQSCHRVETKLGSPTNIQYGTYELILSHVSRRWTIDSIRHHVSWIEGNSSLVGAPSPEWRAAAAAVFGDDVVA